MIYKNGANVTCVENGSSMIKEEFFGKIYHENEREYVKSHERLYPIVFHRSEKYIYGIIYKDGKLFNLTFLLGYVDGEKIDLMYVMNGNTPEPRICVWFDTGDGYTDFNDFPAIPFLEKLNNLLG